MVERAPAVGSDGEFCLASGNTTRQVREMRFPRLTEKRLQSHEYSVSETRSTLVLKLISVVEGSNYIFTRLGAGHQARLIAETLVPPNM